MRRQQMCRSILLAAGLATLRRVRSHSPQSHRCWDYLPLDRLLSCAASGHSSPPRECSASSSGAHAFHQRSRTSLRKLHRLMENEKAQNERLPEPYRSQVLRGADCDEIAGAVGEFGRDPRNPIPVNGPLGELTYLSNLRTADSQPIMFHRLGSTSNVDIYETVSLDGAIWDILFLHPFHPRKSQRPPSGYRIVAGTERNSLLLGVNDFVAAFPDRLSDAIADMSERVFSFRIRPPQVREALARAIFERPTDHLTRLDIILTVLKRQALTPQDAT